MEVFAVIVLIGGFVLYFIPTMIAHSRDAANSGAILVINLLFGWTVIGWIAAMIWACTDSRQAGPASAQEWLSIVLTPKCATIGPAWTQVTIGAPVKLVVDGNSCSVESEFGTVATFKNDDLIKRIAFRTEAQGKPRAKVSDVVDYDFREREIHIGLHFADATPA